MVQNVNCGQKPTYGHGSLYRRDGFIHPGNVSEPKVTAHLSSSNVCRGVPRVPLPEDNHRVLLCPSWQQAMRQPFDFLAGCQCAFLQVGAVPDFPSLAFKSGAKLYVPLGFT